MYIDPLQLKAIFERGKVIDSDESILKSTCEMVYRSHFIHCNELEEDLIQEGIIGIIKLVDDGYYDNTRDVLTFVYSRVRNCMTNFLHSLGKIRSSDIKEIEYRSNSEDIFFFAEKERMEEISIFVNSKIEEYKISDDMKYYIRSYFYDKLGVRYLMYLGKDFSVDFVDKYRYYVNIIEYEIFCKFLNKKFFDSKAKDILDVLEAEGEIGFFQKMFLDSLDKEQLSRIMYVFSNNSFTFPSKYKLLKVDNYLSIYRRIKFGNITEEEAVHVFDKPLPTILNIMQKYDMIFS